VLQRLLLAGGLLCAPAICFAVQPGDTDLCLSGHISDDSGVSAADVAVSVRQSQSESARSVVSDSKGQFQVCGLGAGEYRIDARKAGFEDSVRSETLGASSAPAVNFSLTKVKITTPSANAENPAESIQGFVAHPAALSFDEASDPIFSRVNTAHGQIDTSWGFQLRAEPNSKLASSLPVSRIGASLGGEVGRNNFFASFEGIQVAPQRLMAKQAIEEIRMGNSAPFHEANALSAESFVVRADRRFNERDSAYARFRHDELSVRRSRSNPQDSQLSPGLKMTNQAVTVANTLTISPTTVNESSAQLVVNEAHLPPGAAAIGMQSAIPTIRRNRVFDAATNVYRQTGGGSLRMGADFLSNQMNISFLESSLGRMTAGNSSFSQSDRNSELYVMSQHKLRPNLEATTGIRYDIQSLQGFKTDTNNLAPEAGLAWAPTARTVIKGGVGVYFDQTPLPALAGPSSPGLAANIENSGKFVSRNGRSPEELANFVTEVPSLQNSYAEQANLQVDQQLGAKTVLSVQTEYVRGVQLALPVLKSASLCASAGACNSGNTFEGQELGSGAVSSNEGVSIALTQQPTRWGSYRASYTSSHASGMGNAENTSEISDSMHRLSFTGNLHSSSGPASDFWQEFSHGFALSETVDYTTKSEFAGLSFINIDARLTKTLAWGKYFRLDALAETYNAMQRTSTAYARSLAEMGPGASGVFSTYQRVASMQVPNGSRIGLRLLF